MVIIKALLILCIGLCIGGIGAAAQEVPRIRNLTPADYGAQSQNWSLAQSAEGWMYIGNNSGLLEFDGTHSQLFFMPEKQTVRAVGIGRDNAVFCGGFGEFGFWKENANGILEYTSLSKNIPGDYLSREEIWHILILPDGVLFQSFSAIYKYDYHKVTMLRPPGAIMFARLVGEKVLLPVIGRGVYELLPDNTFSFWEHTQILGDKFVQFLVLGKDGTIWAGTTNNGIFEIKDGHCLPWANPLNAEFKKYQLNKAVTLKNGGWAIGTILSGVYVLEPDGRLRFHLHRENGLQNNTVLALQEDRNGNLWIGLDRGIDCVMLRLPLLIFNDLTGRIGTVYTAAEWQGNLYLGTNQGVFWRPLSDNRVGIQEPKFQLAEGTQGQVWQLYVFDNQLICGHNSGTFTIDRNVVKKISEVTGGWYTVRVPGKPDALLQSTYTGLIVFKKNQAGQWQFSHRVGGFSEPLKKIAFDKGGYLWGVHANKGLFRFQLDSNLTQISTFKSYSMEDGLPNDFRLDLVVLEDQLMLNMSPFPLLISSGQSGQYLFQAAPSFGSGKKILAGFAKEYFKTDSSEVVLWSDNTSHRFPITLVPSFENIVALSADKYLFCLENGYALLDKKKLAETSNMLPASAVIRRIETVSNTTFLPVNGQSFDWQQNSLRFRFAAPAFERQPHFSWKLEGFSPEWSPWQKNPEKEFTNLPEGRYTFAVRTDTGGPEAFVQFRIAPPWYRSSWALAGYFLLAVLLLAVVEHIYRLRLDRQRLRLEAEKERELARQRVEAERELLALEVENKTRELSNAAFNLIRKNTALQHLKEDLLSSDKDAASLRKIVRRIEEHLEGDHDWEIFEESFNRVHNDFFVRLLHNFPDLTPGDLRLAAYLKMNLASKEIAPLLNISVRGVENKRYRLRKKIGLPEEANLTEFILNF